MFGKKTQKKEKPHKEEFELMRRKTSKSLLWIGIVSIIMLFSGLTSAYIVRANNGNWLVFDLPDVMIISTGLIILSSLTMWMAQIAIKKDEKKKTSFYLLITFILGICFIYTQYLGWKELTVQGIFFLGKYSNASGSFLYLIALLHIFHLLGGLISLLITWKNSRQNKYNSTDYLGVEMAAIYWHFIDVLWIYLFLFLYFFR
ncbi:MAG: heme-copper oxidase subunit III [Bacteroidia bacterium]